MLKKPLPRSAPALRSPAPLGHRLKPSVAWAFGGTKVHWTFALFRLTPLRLQVRSSLSVANPLSGTKDHRTFVLARFTHGSLDRGVVRGGTGNGADGRKTESTASRFLRAPIV